MTLRLITAPTAEPVTLADAKLVCGIDADITKWDTLITALISAARSDAEQQTGRTIAAARWERVLDAFPDSGIALAWPVVTSVVSVKYIDTAGTLQTLASTAYTLDADYLPGWVLPSAASVACAVEAPVGAAPAVETMRLSSAFDPVIQPGVTVDVAGSEIIFTARDEQGRPLAGARITLNGGAQRVADSAGRVSFPVVRGRHVLLIEADGYPASEVVVVV